MLVRLKVAEPKKEINISGRLEKIIKVRTASGWLRRRLWRRLRRRLWRRLGSRRSYVANESAQRVDVGNLNNVVAKEYERSLVGGKLPIISSNVELKRKLDTWHQKNRTVAPPGDPARAPALVMLAREVPKQRRH